MLGKTLPASTGESLHSEFICQLTLGDCCSSDERCSFLGVQGLQSRIHLGINPGDKERRHRVDPGQIGHATLEKLLEALDVGINHRVIAIQGEDQRDVDRDCLGDGGANRPYPGLSGWDLHEQVRCIDLIPQEPRCLFGSSLIVCECWGHLYRHESVGLG